MFQVCYKNLCLWGNFKLRLTSPSPSTGGEIVYAQLFLGYDFVVI